MKFIRATRRSNGTPVYINVEHITAIQLEESETLHYTAIVLDNGREIDVIESPETLLQPAALHLIEL